MPNEIKRIYFDSESAPVASGDVEAGTYDLTFDAQTTSSINYNDSAATIQAALEALSSIGSGNVAVALTANGYTVEFQGALADTNVGDLTAGNITLKQKADTVSATTTTNGEAGVAEVHTISMGGATTGTFVLTNGFASPEVSTLDTAGISAAYDAMYGPGVSISDIGGGNFTATFPTEGGQSNPSVSSNSTDGSPSVTVDTEGATPVYQVATVTIPNSPTEGTLNVTLDGSTSSDFNWNDSSPATISGWTGGGSAGNWTYTRDTAAADVSVSGAEGSAPLRKDCGIEIVTTQEGSAGVNVESPTVLLDFLGVAPNTAKSFASGQGIIDFLAIAPLFSLTAVSGQGLIDFTATQSASSKLSAQPAGLLDFLAPALTETITAPSPVAIVALASTQPATAKTAAQQVALLDISAVATGSQHAASADPSLVDFTSVAALANKAASLGPGLLEVSAPALTESLVADSGIALIDIAAAAPSVSRTAELGAAILYLAPVAPSVSKTASIAVAAIEFVATEIVAAYGLGFTVIAAHFYTLEPAAIDSLELTKATQAMSLDPRKATAFVLDTHITQAFSGDTRRVDAP